MTNLSLWVKNGRERFSRLEAFFLSKSLEGSEPTFQTVKMPTKAPPASAVKVTEPFFQPNSTDRPVVRPDLYTDQAHVVTKCDQPQSVDIQ